MRFCLACRHLSSDTPLCSHCGRSFGGRLCDHKKGRHLNPSAAQVCGTCGSTRLTLPTSHLPLRLPWRLLIVAVGLGLLGNLWGTRSGGSHPIGSLGAWLGGLFTRSTGFLDPRVWLIETLARVLMPLLILYFLSAFIPGEAGRQFRSLMTGLLQQTIRLVFGMLQGAFKGVGKLLLGILSRERGKNRTGI